MKDSIYLWYNQQSEQYFIGRREEYLLARNMFSKDFITNLYTMCHDEMEIGKKIIAELNLIRANTMS